jgi:hypothetical protein
MYNKDILDELVRKFGEEKTIIFCKMEAVKNAMLYDGAEQKHLPEPNEWGFERDWWAENAKKLEDTRFNKQIKIDKK